MEIKRVAPETTDVLRHVDERRHTVARPVRQSRKGRRRADIDTDSDLVFGSIPKSTVGLIALAFMFIIALLFGIKELGMNIPVYLIVLVFCTAMGVLLAKSPGFVSVIVSALLLIVGALTSLFPGVALGVAMLVAASLIIRGE